MTSPTASAGFITIDRLEAWAEAAITADEDRHVRILIDAIRRDLVESARTQIGDYIRGCSLVPAPASSALEPTARSRPAGAPEARASRLNKKIALELVFQSPQLQQLDFKADQMLGRLLGALMDNYLGSPRRRLRLLPPAQEASLEAALDEAGRRRRLCDFLAALTDASATRLYRRLYEPHFGGLADLL